MEGWEPGNMLGKIEDKTTVGIKIKSKNAKPY